MDEELICCWRSVRIVAWCKWGCGGRVRKESSERANYEEMEVWEWWMKWRGGRRAFYKQQELEIVKWENRYSLKTSFNVDEGESKASREYRGGPLGIVWLLIWFAMRTVSVPSLPDLTLSNSTGTYILSFCTFISSLALLVLSIIKFCRSLWFIGTFFKFTTSVVFFSMFWCCGIVNHPQVE